MNYDALPASLIMIIDRRVMTESPAEPTKTFLTGLRQLLATLRSLVNSPKLKKKSLIVLFGQQFDF